MADIKTAPYGTWESPIKPEDFAASGKVIIDQVYVNQQNGKIYWVENRPDEGGRGTIMEQGDGGPREVLPKEFNASTQVQEYGGGSMQTRDSDGHIIFSDFKSKVIYDLDPESGKVVALIDEDPRIYYADYVIHPTQPDYILAIKEDHHYEKIEDIKTTLVAISAKTSKQTTLAEGADFYSFCRVSPDGKKVCWTQWMHPNMPWDHTQLWVGDWTDGHVSNAQPLAGHDVECSNTQPVWSSDNSLFHVSDQTGYWQIHQWIDGVERHRLRLEGYEDAEFAAPDWLLGASLYTPLTPDTILAFAHKDGAKRAVLIDTHEETVSDLQFPIIDLQMCALKRVSNTTAAVIGSTTTVPTSLFLLDITRPSEAVLVKESAKVDFHASFFSIPQNITFPRICGSSNQCGDTAYGLFLPPTNPQYQAPQDTLPPLIIATHGGPTWQTGHGINMHDQFWTSRGYAVAQVNFVGSSGYGTPYRRLLNGNWGLADIDDVASCVKYLVDKRLVDPKRIGITGHSAGGYVAMQALVAYPELFTASVAVSGISDMQALFETTHKFEAQYLQPLCFSPDALSEEKKRIIKERSPINHTDKIATPLLILSGADDAIVPPNQALLMAEKVKAGGGVVDVRVYDGEGHIFRKGSSLQDMEERKEAWFRKYLVEA